MALGVEWLDAFLHYDFDDTSMTLMLMLSVKILKRITQIQSVIAKMKQDLIL